MPASWALRPVAVSALPSNGRMTMTSTFLLISVSTWLICWLTSLVPSTASSFTSLYLAAWDFAFAVIAPIQPWSASGAEKPMVIALPAVVPAPDDAPLGAGAPELAAALAPLLLLVQAVSAAPAPSAPAPIRKRRRPTLMGVSDMCVPPLDFTSRGLGFRGSCGTGLEQDCGENDDALGDVLHLCRQVVEDEDVRDGLEDEDTEDRADQGASTTGEQGSADDHRSDGVELVELSVGARPRRGPRHEHRGGDTAAQAREGVQQESVSADVDAREARRLGVPAEGERASPEGRPVEQQPSKQHDDREQDDEIGDTEDVVQGDPLDALLGDQLDLVVGQLGGEAAGAHHHRKGDDERDEPPVRDEQAVDHARSGSHEQCAHDHDPGPVVLRGERRRPHRRECDECAD